jgi:hypothetical protein
VQAAKPQPHEAPKHAIEGSHVAPRRWSFTSGGPRRVGIWGWLVTLWAARSAIGTSLSDDKCFFRSSGSACMSLGTTHCKNSFMRGPCRKLLQDRARSDLPLPEGLRSRIRKQDTFDGWRHLAASFFPINALDEGFSAVKLAALHTAPLGKSYAPEPRCTRSFAHLH